MNIAIIFAGGIGQRLSEKNTNIPKQFIKVYDKPIIVYTIENFQIHDKIDKIYISVLPEYKEYMEKLVKDYNLTKVAKIVNGGATAQDSIYNALIEAQKENDENSVVLIHDGARPFVSEQIVKDVFDVAVEFGASVPGIAPVDTQKVVDANGFITQHLHRNMMCAVQTPQGFDFAKLLEAHQKAAEDNQEYTDDTEIWGTYVGSVKVVKGDEKNKKITFSSDYDSNKGNAMIRVGLGYDIHQLVEGRKLILGGIEIPFEKGEKGHSDGDALLHAVTDALLGASGLGDIGSFFPPEDNKWKDANSVDLLKTVWQKITDAGWKLENLDCVIKLEQPKFLPFRENVINSIAKALDVPAEKVFVKAKTGEKMDCVGTGNAVEAWCNCLLSK